jgi:AcrR family transcriptional regulator
MTGSRDADNTRQLLLRAARERFARDGYSATTVREIAADAGVNVALINRYFTSKEGLFEACIARVGQELGPAHVPDRTPAQVAQELVRQVIGYSTGEGAEQLLLLLRTSGDERIDRIRSDILRSFGQRLAGVAGWPANDDDRALLHAQLVLATALGIVQLRATTDLEPLRSATQDDLSAPMSDILTTLLSARG